LGFGNVNRAFVTHYLSIADAIAHKYNFTLRFVAVCDSTSVMYGSDLKILDMIERKEQHYALGEQCTNPLDRVSDLIDGKKIDVIVDGLPTSKTGEGPTFPLLIEASRQNVAVICVNKAPLVFKGKKLLKTARENRTSIGLSGTTAASLPTSGVMLNELAGSEIKQIRGVVNGTSNYVLDSVMFKGLRIDEAIQHAVDLGIAEPDYRYDLDGTDTCFKMIILGLLATGEHVHPRDVPRTGLEGLDEHSLASIVKQEKVMRLIGTCTMNDTIPKISVAPEILDESDPLFSVRGTGKGVVFKTNYMGELTVIEKSSSRTSIAATILKDVINVVRD
jgi:homoserine dehydrogenase